MQTAFSTAPHRLGKIQEIQFRYEHDPILKSQEDSAYAPNTLHTSLYCVTHADSFEDALKCANNIETYYCPTLVGIFAGARWLVPQSMLTNIQKDTLKKMHEVAKCFTNK